MMNQKPKRITQDDYRKRIANVLSYLWEHEQEDINIEQLAEVACFSVYHFHRIYRQLVGESVYQSLIRLRMQKAAYRLIMTELSISEVASLAQYGSNEAFSRAFKSSFAISPAQFRKVKQEAFADPCTLPDQRNYPMSYSVQIKEISAIPLVGRAHTGDYLGIGATFEQLFMQAGMAGAMNASTRCIGIYYDDPSAKPKESLRSHACISATEEVARDLNLEALCIPAGRYAVLNYKGPYAELEQAYAWFYGHWLTESPYEPEDHPPFEEYLNNPRELPPSEWLTDIYLPIKSQ